MTRQSPEALLPRLEPSETVLWAGSPRSGWQLFRDYPHLLLGPIAWALTAFAHGIVIPFPGATTVTATFGVFALFLTGHLLFEAHRRDNTIYVITNARLFILRTGLVKRVATTWLDRIAAVRFERHEDGSGSVFVEPEQQPGDTAYDLRRFPKTHIVRLAFIEDVKSVHDVLVTARQQFRPA